MDYTLTPNSSDRNDSQRPPQCLPILSSAQHEQFLTSQRASQHLFSTWQRKEQSRSCSYIGRNTPPTSSKSPMHKWHPMARASLDTIRDPLGNSPLRFLVISTEDSLHRYGPSLIFAENRKVCGWSRVERAKTSMQGADRTTHSNGTWNPKFQLNGMGILTPINLNHHVHSERHLQ